MMDKLPAIYIFITGPRFRVSPKRVSLPMPLLLLLNRVRSASLLINEWLSAVHPLERRSWWMSWSSGERKGREKQREIRTVWPTNWEHQIDLKSYWHEFWLNSTPSCPHDFHSFCLANQSECLSIRHWISRGNQWHAICWLWRIDF